MKLKLSLLLSSFLILAACASSSVSTNPRVVSSDDLPPIPAKTEKIYPHVDMSPGLSQRDKDNHVVCFDDADRNKHRVVIQNGVVFTTAGAFQPDSHNDHHNHENYVMDETGNFYIFDEHTFSKIRHSSIFCGGSVSGAGEIQIQQARIIYIDSDSGHYPSARVFKSVIQELVKDGADTSQMQLQP